MRVATIVPIPYLQLTTNDDYFMALAHLIDTKDEMKKKYMQFFKDRAAEGKFVIMDNGAAENSQVTVEDLVVRGSLINASELILPDTIYNRHDTLWKSYKALEMFESIGVKCRFMAVPQGETITDWIMCAKEMVKWPIDTIGVSKFLTKKLGYWARWEAVNALYKMEGFVNSGKEIHLLGCHESPEEVNKIQKDFNVRGVDSAIAYAYASKGLYIEDYARPQHEIDFFDDKTDTKLLQRNIQKWRELCVTNLF